MDTNQFITILGSIVTLVILPLLIDWIKRRWDYNTNVSKSRFDVLSELNTLIWNYHAITGRLYQLAAFMEFSDDEISDDEIKEVTRRFVEASDALYTGLYSCRSRIHQYFDEYRDIELAIDDLREWTFHTGKAPDNDYLSILHSLTKKVKLQAIQAKAALDKKEATKLFKDKAEAILQPLGQHLREMSSFWYPVKRQFRRGRRP